MDNSISEAITSEYSLPHRRQLFTASTAVRFLKILSWSGMAIIAEDLEQHYPKLEWSCPSLMLMAISTKNDFMVSPATSDATGDVQSQ
jgi:hypothetical protein